MRNTIRTKIVGVTYKNEDGTNRQELIELLDESDPLHLVDMSSFEYPEAIGVFNSSGDQLGFLNKSLAEDVRNMDGNFEEFPVSILEITGGFDRTYGCNIEITLNDNYHCLITLKKDDGISIKTPLVDVVESNHPNVTVGDRVTLCNVGVSIAVLDESEKVLGFLPPSPCEQIRTRHIDLATLPGEIIATHTEDDGTPYLKALFDSVDMPLVETPAPNVSRSQINVTVIAEPSASKSAQPVTPPPREPEPIQIINPQPVSKPPFSANDYRSSSYTYTKPQKSNDGCFKPLLVVGAIIIYLLFFK